MAYKVIKAHGSVQGIAKRVFIVDTAAEITDLPTNKKIGKAQSGDTVSDEMCAVGSTATVSETGDTYELNASGVWVKKPVEGSGGDSDITIDSTLTQEGQAADAKATGDALATKANTTDLSSYVKSSTAESTYAKKTDLSGYMTEATADGKYAAKTDLSDYATTETLSDYATTASLSSYMQTSTADSKYATKTELDGYATTDALGSYVQTDTAESTYAKKTDLTGYATTSSLDSYMQTTTADGKYATKSELGSYATTASLADYAKTSELPKGTAVTDATGETDAHTQLNALLASLRAAGIIASS